MLKILGLDLETSLGNPKLFGPDSKDPSNDFYTIIYGNNPNEKINVLHNEEGWKRKLPVNIFDGVDIVVGHNLSFDLGYVWKTPEFQRFVKSGGQIWCTAQTQYLLSGKRHKFPSLAELQLLYLGEKVKESRISWCFSHNISPADIIKGKDKCSRVWELYNKYCADDVSTVLKIFALQYKKCKQLGIIENIKTHMKGLLGITAISKTGMHLDIVRCEETLKDLKIKSVEYLEEASKIITPMWDDRLGAFNINSPAHKSAILFGGEFTIKEKKEVGTFKNGNPKFKNEDVSVYIKGFGLTKNLTAESKVSGRYVTDAKVINKICNTATNKQAVEYCQLQKKAMNYGKMASTYIEPFLNFNINGVLFPKYNTTLTVTGRLSSSAPNMQNCCSEDTEVLTRQGWKLLSMLQDGEDVYQVDPNTFEGSFVTPSRIVKQSHEGNLIAIKAQWGEFLYTPEHRVISYDRKGVSFIENAYDWLSFKGSIIDRKILRSSNKKGGVYLTEAEKKTLELAIIVQAEGYLDLKRKVPCYNLKFRGKRKIEQIQKIFPDLELPGSNILRFNIAVSDVGHWLDSSKEKNFTTNILNLCVEDLRWFLETLHKWDGDFVRQKTYGQKRSKRTVSLDLVQAAACMSGYSTSWYNHPSKDFSVVNFHPNKLRSQSKTEVFETPYKGVVYCVTVPTGAFLIRRNKQVVVTGNCPASGEMFETIQGNMIAPDGWTALSIDYNQLEPFTTALLTEDMALANDLLMGVCLHCRAVSWIPRMAEGKTYEEIYQLAVVEKHPDWVLKRKKAKAINFKRAYGGGAKSLAEAEGLDVEDVQAVFDGQDLAYPDVKAFNERLFEELVKNQQFSRASDYSKQSKAGRKFEFGLELLPIFKKGCDKPEYRPEEYRHHSVFRSRFGDMWAFEEIGHIDRNGCLRRNYSTTQTKNYHIQGTAGTIVEMAIAECFEYIRSNAGEVRMIRQIHDELGFYIKKGTESKHIPQICAIMSDIQHLFRKYLKIEVPFNFRVEAKVGQNFAQMEVYDESRDEIIRANVDEGGIKRNVP
jgi:hypothetical protein